MPDYTTRDIALKLGIILPQALALLHGARVPRRRCGAAYLWDGQAVERLLAALRGQGIGGAHTDAAGGGRP